jgi:hypothetical protein
MPATEEESVAPRKTHDYGMRPCPACGGEGGWYRNLTWMLCHFCGGKGLVRL